MVISRGGNTRGGGSRAGVGRGRGRLTGGGGGGGRSTALVGRTKLTRGKLPASESPPEERPLKRPASSARRKVRGDEEASTSLNPVLRKAAAVAGGSPPGRSKSNHRAASSHDSNPVGPLSPSSQGTPQSHGNGSASRTNLVPLQFPASSQRSGQQTQPTSSQRVNLNLPPPRQHIDFPVEEDDEGDIDGDDEEDIEPDVDGVEDDAEGLELGQDQGDAEGEDYEQMLANLLAHPARQSLPLLSQGQIPGKKTLW